MIILEYGCIGEHLKHSFSKEIHACFCDYNYELCEIAPQDINEFFTNKNFKAVNVTIPYKETVIKYLDFIDESAKNIGAVNTIVNKSGKLYGYNTDFLGLKSLITVNNIGIKLKKVLILGSGGTSKTAKAVAKSLGAKEIICASRTEKTGFVTYDEVYKKHTDANIVINTTPCGMYPNIDGSAICLDNFNSLSAVVDVVYNPIKTDLLEQAEAKGAKAVGGLYMLVAQAAFAAEKFVDIKIETEKIKKVYKKILNNKQNIVLIGMPACGKSTNGKKIAEYLGREFFDSDAVIENAENLKIKEIFNQFGESAFRKKECAVIKNLSKLSGVVISTGGGVVLNSDNMRYLKKNGKIYFIDRELEKLICTNSRPLSSNKKDLTALYAFRHPLYEKYADYVLKSDNTFSELKEIINENFGN